MALIEKFLLQKLDEALTETKSSNFSGFIEEIRKLKDLIETKMPEDGALDDPTIKEKLYALNNTVADWKAQSEKQHLLTPLNLEASSVSKKIEGGLKHIRNKLEGSVHGGRRSDSEIYKWSSSWVDLAKIHGIDDKGMIMERLLIKKGFKAIGIVGMAGVGKTALCQKAFNNQQVKKHFLPRIWVCLSKQPNVDNYEEEIVKRILMRLGFEDKIIDQVGKKDPAAGKEEPAVGKVSLSRLLFALRLQLKRQRYLIVLDDWNKDSENFCSPLTQDDEIKPDRLEYGLPKGHGGTVIITGRSPKMAERIVGEKNLHSLLPHAVEASCWKIFEDAATKDGIPLTKEMETLKVKIQKNCAGLPLIAKMLGQIEHDKMKKQQSQTQPETQKHEA